MRILRRPAFRIRRCLSCAALLALASVLVPAPVLGQAVYGSVAGTVVDNSGGILPGVTVTITSLERKTVDTVVSNESGFYVKDRLLPGLYEVRAELEGFKAAVVPQVDVRVDTQVPIDLTLEVGQLSETVTVTGVTPLLVDRPRRRGDDVRIAGADAVARDRPELHEVRSADARHAAASVVARGVGEPAGLDADPDQRTALQRHRLPARRHREPRRDPGDHRRSTRRSSPSARRRSRRRTTTRSSVRRPQASSRCRPSRARNEFHGTAFEFHQSDAFQARNPFSQSQPDPLTGRYIPETQREPVRGLDRRPDRREPLVLLRRLPGHAAGSGRIAAADGADRSRAPR